METALGVAAGGIAFIGAGTLAAAFGETFAAASALLRFGAEAGAMGGAPPAGHRAAGILAVSAVFGLAFGVTFEVPGFGFGFGTLAHPLYVAWILFFILLPLANAALDWPSWAISRWLGHDLHDLMKGERRRLGRWLKWVFRRVWQPAAFAMHILHDLAAVLVMLLALAALLCFVIQLFNGLVSRTGVEAPLVLESLLTEAHSTPWPNAFWPVAMLLTTLIPTALHAGALIIGLVLWLIQPTAWRADIVEGLRTRGSTAKAKHELAWAATRASWLLILTPIVAGALVVLLGWGLVRLIGLVEPVGLLLLDAAHLGIAAADWLVGPVAP